MSGKYGGNSTYFGVLIYSVERVWSGDRMGSFPQDKSSPEVLSFLSDGGWMSKREFGIFSRYGVTDDDYTDSILLMIMM